MKIWIGLGWELNKDIFEEDIDVDLTAFQLNKEGKVNTENDFIFYNNPVSDTGSVRFTGDNKIGSTAGNNLDNEIIEIDTDKIPDYVDRIIITASIYEAEKRKQNFAMVLNAYARVIQENDDELIRYDLSEDFSYDKSVLIGEIIRQDENLFKFNLLGTSFEGELGGLCEKYGLYVND